MADDNRDALDAIESRLRNARGRRQDPLVQQDDEAQKKGNVLGLAFRVAVEIVSALAIGFGVGWLLDDWLGSKPWLMIIFVLVGFVAGILNVYRMASGFGYVAGYTEGNKHGVHNIRGDEEK